LVKFSIPTDNLPEKIRLAPPTRSECALADRGGPALRFLYPPSFPVQWLIEASEFLLCHATRRQHLCIEFTRGRRQRKLKDPNGVDLTNWLSETHVVFGFAKEIAHFSDVLQLGANCIILIGSVDRRSGRS
jgi:hypothetical protein